MLTDDAIGEPVRRRASQPANSVAIGDAKQTVGRSVAPSAHHRTSDPAVGRRPATDADGRRRPRSNRLTSAFIVETTQTFCETKTLHRQPVLHSLKRAVNCEPATAILVPRWRDDEREQLHAPFDIATVVNQSLGVLKYTLVVNINKIQVSQRTTRGCHRRLCVLSFRSFGGICETASCPVRELAYPRVVQLPPQQSL